MVPVYVNLREWDGPNSPSDDDIAAFIRKHMKREAGRAGGRFLNEWYEPMLDHGRFFFLLDSFDEMPVVLDCDDASPRIKKISRAFDRFFHDIHNCRGVLASRRFRQPRGFRGRRISIRPFEEAQIRSAMARWLVGQLLDPEKLIREVFRRPDLIPAIRNPFLADLITHYVIHNHGQLPLSHFAIYDDYIQQRLKADAKDLEELSIKPDDLIDAAATIAWAMYNDPKIGLDVDLHRLRDLVQLPDFDSIVVALRSTRMVRVGGVRSQNLSFVHRRFAEFFVVRAMISNEQSVPLDAIPEDSRWRDCLVVYCGVAPKAKAQPIANFCWNVIEQDHVDGVKFYQGRRAIHSLRFLRDAFLGRPDCLVGFQGKLSRRILKWIGDTDLLVAKVAAEALGLLSPNDRSKGVSRAFERKSVWIQETALRACRHLPGLEAEAKLAIRRYVRTLPTPKLFRSYGDLSFGFSLSEDLRFQRWALRLDVSWLLLLWSSLLIAMMQSPWAAAFVVTVIAIAISLEILNLIYIRFPFRFKSIYRPVLDPSLRFPTLLFLVYFAALFGLLPFIPDKLLSVDENLARAFRDTWNILLFQGNIGAAALAAFIVTPWEFWINAWAPLTLLRRWWLHPGLLGAVAGIASFTMFLLYNWERTIPFLEWYASISEYLAVIMGAGAGAVLLRDAWRQASDQITLRRLSLPEQVDRAWVHEICRSLKSSSGRLRFLELLRLRNVEATDEPGPWPTDQPWLDNRVMENLARLEAVWQGLEE